MSWTVPRAGSSRPLRTSCRTPIAVITGYAEFLQASDPPPVQRGEILDTMRRHGDQITGIVSELLTSHASRRGPAATSRWSGRRSRPW